MPAVGNQDNPGHDRSTFVTVVAWIFLVLTGFFSFASLVQNIVVWTMFPGDKSNGLPGSAPGALKFIFWSPKIFFLFFLTVSVFTLVSSIGLLRRMNWARISFICILGFGIAWMAFGIVNQWTWHTGPGVQHDDTSGAIFKMIMIMTVVISIVLGILFGWIIIKLRSDEIKKEFNPKRLDGSSSQ